MELQTAGLESGQLGQWKGWLVHGEASEDSAAITMENLTRLGQELHHISIVILPVRPLDFLRYILHRGAGRRHSLHGSMLWSIKQLKSRCAPLCLMMRCWCLVLNVTAGWHLIHASPPCSMVTASVPRSSNTKHAFPARR